MNYSELYTAIGDYLLNDETTFQSHIPDIVRAAEQDIYRNTQLPDLRKNVTGTTTASNKYLSLPSDFLSVYSLAVIDDNSAHQYLLNKEVDFIRQAYPTAGSTGQPKYYALFDDDSVILGPTPDDTYTVELHYFYLPNSIVDDSTTWLGTNAETCLLYGCLVHGYMYMKGEPELMQEYQNQYNRALSNLQLLSEGRMRKDTYRTPNTRAQT